MSDAFLTINLVESVYPSFILLYGVIAHAFTHLSRYVSNHVDTFWTLLNAHARWIIGEIRTNDSVQHYGITRRAFRYGKSRH